MRKAALLTVALWFLLGSSLVEAMGEKQSTPLRQDKVTYAEVVGNHPGLEEMVDENAFNSLSGKEQWELISMVDRYSFFTREAEYTAGDRGSQASYLVYSQKAKSLKEEIHKRFGHVLKK